MVTKTYEFRVDGRLSDQAREAFCDMRIEEVPSGAILYGDVIDESHLLGILAQCRTLGLVVVSAHAAARGELAAAIPEPRSATAPTSGDRAEGRG